MFAIFNHSCLHACVCVRMASHVLTIMLYVNIIMISELEETALKVEQHRSPNVNNAVLRNLYVYSAIRIHIRIKHGLQFYFILLSHKIEFR